MPGHAQEKIIIVIAGTQTYVYSVHMQPTKRRTSARQELNLPWPTLAFCLTNAEIMAQFYAWKETRLSCKLKQLFG